MGKVSNLALDVYRKNMEYLDQYSKIKYAYSVAGTVCSSCEGLSDKEVISLLLNEKNIQSSKDVKTKRKNKKIG